MSIDVTAATAIPAGTWTIDPSHSEVGFTVRHLMSKVRGQFEKFEGTRSSPATPSSATATHRPQLHQHPRREPRRPPALRRLLRRREQRPDDVRGDRRRGGGKGLLVTGDLTIKGVTKPVDLDVEFLGIEQRPLGRHPRRLRGAPRRSPARSSASTSTSRSTAAG